MKTNYKSQKQQSRNRNRNRINNSKKLQKSKLYKKIPSTTKTKKHGNKLSKKTIKKKIKKGTEGKNIKQNGGAFRTLANGDIESRQFLSFTESNLVYEVTPYPLNAMVLQNLCNMGKIDINNGYVSFTKHPCLVVKQRQITTSSGPKILPQSNKFLTIYEGPGIEIPSINGNKLSIPVREVLDDSKQLQITNDISYMEQLLESINHPRSINSNDLQYSKFNIDEEEDNIRIIGFPDPKHMTPLLSNRVFMENFQTLAESQKKNYLDWLISLYNYGEKDGGKSDGQDDLAKDKDKEKEDTFDSSKGPISDKLTESYKLINGDLIYLKHYLSYFMPREDIEQRKIVDSYYQRLQSIINRDNIFSRPNCRIKYQFFVFKKNSDGKYELLIKNIRELTSEHTPFLERILQLIQTEIPKRFGLLLPNEKIYENFYSYTELGKLFSIVTEFLHPTTRLETFAFLYKQRILLEELIYSSGLTVKNERLEDVPFWSIRKFEYPVKNFNLSDSIIDELQDNNNNDSQNVLHGGGKPQNISLNLSNATIIMCNLISSFDVEIIYQDIKRDYWRLILESNILGVNNLRNREKIKRQAEYVHGSSLETMYLPTIDGLSIYHVKNHQKITNNLFKKNSSIPLWNFPVIRHKKIYDYPFQDKYPQNMKEILEKAFSMLKVSSSVDSNITISEQDYDNDHYFVIDKGDSDLLIVDVTHPNTKKTHHTVWVFNKKFDETNPIAPRMKSILDLSDPSLLSTVIELLLQFKRYNPNTFSVYTHLYAGYTLNHLHLKILENNYYESPTYKSDISQSTESRSISVNNVIHTMKTYPTFYTELKNKQPNGFPLYGRYLLQFIE